MAEFKMTEFDERCLICGDFIDYCLGHGTEVIMDFWDAHESGDHSRCNPLACLESASK